MGGLTINAEGLGIDLSRGIQGEDGEVLRDDSLTLGPWNGEVGAISLDKI